MRKRIILFVSLLATLANVAISCSASTEEKQAASEQADSTAVIVPSEFILTENGFGELRLNNDVNAVKDNPVDGLYDSITLEKTYNEMEDIEQLTGVLSLNGNTVANIIAETDSTIYFIQFVSNAVKLEVNGNIYSIGDSFKKLSDENGVTLDDYGSAIINGVTVYDVNDKIGSFNLGSPF